MIDKLKSMGPNNGPAQVVEVPVKDCVHNFSETKAGNLNFR